MKIESIITEEYYLNILTPSNTQLENSGTFQIMDWSPKYSYSWDKCDGGSASNSNNGSGTYPVLCA